MARHRRSRFPGGRGCAFSLVEVVIALGLFSVGIAVVLRLFAGISDSVRLTGETETGLHAAETLMRRMRARPFDDVANCLLTADELRQMDSSEGIRPLSDHRLFFVDATAEMIGQNGDLLWIDHEREKYFEIALARDENLSPRTSDALASCLVFTARIRWPASARTGAHRAVLSGSVDRQR